MSQNKPKPKARRPRRATQPTLPLLLILGGVLLVAGVLFALGRGRGGLADFTPEVQGAPALKADREKIDLGEVTLGTTVQVEFTLTNAGDQTLRVTENPYIEVVEGC